MRCPNLRSSRRLLICSDSPKDYVLGDPVNGNPFATKIHGIMSGQMLPKTQSKGYVRLMLRAWGF